MHFFYETDHLTRRSERFLIFSLGAQLFSHFKQRGRVCKTAFSARDQHGLSFSHWSHYFLAILSKAHEFVQNSVFSPWSACFVIFQPGHHFLATFIKCTSLHKTGFSAPDQNVLPFSHWCRTFQRFSLTCTPFNKVHEFVQNSVFSPRRERFAIFALSTQFLSVFSKVYEFVRNSVFSPRSARFVIFALGAPLFRPSFRAGTQWGWPTKLSVCLNRVWK